MHAGSCEGSRGQRSWPALPACPLLAIPPLQVRELAGRARANKLQPHEFQVRLLRLYSWQHAHLLLSQ